MIPYLDLRLLAYSDVLCGRIGVYSISEAEIILAIVEILIPIFVFPAWHSQRATLAQRLAWLSFIIQWRHQ
jgi:hypothetical protein